MNETIENKALPKRKSPRLQCFDYSSPGAYFVTICTKDKKCILSTIVGTGVLDCPKMELTRYGEIAKKNIERMGAFYEHISIDGYVIMPNHIHLMLVIKSEAGASEEKKSSSTYSRFVSTLKRFCDREYGENIWQARSNDHVIRNEKDYEEHMKYINENPLKWASDEFYSER